MIYYMSNNTILNSFKYLNKQNVEYELHFGSYDKNTYKYTSLISKESFEKLFNLESLFDSKKTVYSTSKIENCYEKDVRAITTYYEGTSEKNFNKSPFENNSNKIFEKKSKLHTFFIDGSAIKIIVSKEEPFTKGKIKGNKYRIKKRITKISKDGIWRFDFTKIFFDITGNSIKENIKNREPSYNVELEYISENSSKQNNPKKYFQSLKDILKIVLECIPETVQPLNMRVINKVLKKFKQNYSNPRNRLQNQDITNVNMNGGFMNQVIPLEQKTFQFILQNYAVTEKADGERYFIYIDDDGKCYQIAKSKEVVDLDIEHKMKNALLDCEYIPSLKKYMVFDILIHNDIDISSTKLEERIKVISKYDLKTKTIIIQEKKQYIPDDKNTIFNLSKQVFTKKYPYELDGLIYTPIDKGYFSRVYKWKPQKMNTVDFLFRQSPINKDEYFVFASISQFLFKKKRFKLDNNYKKLFPEYSDKIQKRKIKFFPYYFSSSYSNKLVRKSDLNTEEQKLLKDNIILECVLDVNRKIWIPERSRDDKTDIYLQTKKEGYFRGPNGWGIAESTLQLIINPISEKMILEGIYNNKIINYYQQGENSNRLKLVRKYHNHIKIYLYKKYVFGGSIIEIAGGRGGDLLKLNHRKVDFLLLTDLSQDALNEAKKRYKRMKTKMKVKFMQGDFNNNLIDKIKKEIGPREEVDIISCQFAFHYFLKNKKSLDTIFKNIDTFLKKGGYFIFTTFDGKLVHNHVKNEELNIKKDEKTIVKIKKRYNNKNLKNLGQEVDVYVESIGEHPEYLVNYEYIINYFKENGYELVESELFSKKFGDFKGLRKEDKEFSGLNRYNVIKKI